MKARFMIEEPDAIEAIQNIIDGIEEETSPTPSKRSLEQTAALKLAIAALKGEGARYSIEDIQAWEDWLSKKSYTTRAHQAIPVDDVELGIAAWKAAQIERKT